MGGRWEVHGRWWEEGGRRGGGREGRWEVVAGRQGGRGQEAGGREQVGDRCVKDRYAARGSWLVGGDAGMKERLGKAWGGQGGGNMRKEGKKEEEEKEEGKGGG